MRSRTVSLPRAELRQGRRRVAAIAGAFAILAALTQFPMAADAATPKHGGTLNVAATSMQSNMSPTQIGVGYEDAGTTAAAIYGYLAYLTPKDGSVHLQFLRSITPSKGDKVWTLVLHSGIQFSDGTPLNAAAIRYTLQQMSSPNSGDPNFKIIETWREQVVNATTLKITLPQADSGFPAEVTQYFPWIGSPTAWQKAGINFGTNPVGAGPFKLQSWTQNAQMTLVPNPYYKNFAPGQPYLDKIVVNEASQPSQLISALQSGQDQAAWLQGRTQFNDAKAAGMNVQEVLASGGEYLLFNTAKPPFNNLLARKAVSDALNHQQLASVWSPGTTPFMNLFAPSSPYYNKANNFSGTNTAEAMKLFSQLHSQGVNMNFSFVTVTTYAASADYLQATLDKYPGVHVTPQLENISQYIADAKDGNFGIFAFGLNFANPWPSVPSTFGPTGGANFGHWVDPKVTQALNKISHSESPAVLKKNYNIIAKEMATQEPIYPAQDSELAYATTKSVQNVQTIEYGATPLVAQMWLSNS